MARKVTALKLVDPPPLRIDLGCGQNKMEGFTGVDLWSGADVRHDLFKFPWPFKDDSVDEVRASHFFEHVPGKLRPKFMNELYRVMKPAAKATFIVPYWNSYGAVQDYTHEWPPICEQSFLYWNKGWREQCKLTHYEATCDFDFTYGHNFQPAVQARNPEYQQHAVVHYCNAASELVVVLTKR